MKDLSKMENGSHKDKDYLKGRKFYDREVKDWIESHNVNLSQLH